MKDRENHRESGKFPGLGFGLFILIASLLTLGEYLGVVPKDLKWGLPTIGIIWGVTLIIQAIFTKR